MTIALIVRCNAAGAQFRNLVLTDAFHISIEYWKRTSSLNMDQMAPDEDGDFTFVIAPRDPGVHNWLDNGGCAAIFGQRWQAFARRAEPGAVDDVAGGEIVPIDRELPDGVKRINLEDRAAQLAFRMTGFARRFETE